MAKFSYIHLSTNANLADMLRKFADKFKENLTEEELYLLNEVENRLDLPRHETFNDAYFDI